MLLLRVVFPLCVAVLSGCAPAILGTLRVDRPDAELHKGCNEPSGDRMDFSDRGISISTKLDYQLISVRPSEGMTLVFASDTAILAQEGDAPEPFILKHKDSEGNRLPVKGLVLEPKNGYRFEPEGWLNFTSKSGILIFPRMTLNGNPAEPIRVPYRRRYVFRILFFNGC